VLIDKHQNGFLLGVDELQYNRPSPTCFILLTDAVVLKGDQSDLDHFQKNHDKPFRDWSRSRPINKSSVYERLNRLLSIQLEEQLAIQLVDLVVCLGRQVADGIEIGASISRKNLSDILGGTQESVIRVISQWSKNGMIGTEKRRLRSLSPVG
jgi:CRP-like cAMP-binding protein